MCSTIMSNVRLEVDIGYVPAVSPRRVVWRVLIQMCVVRSYAGARWLKVGMCVFHRLQLCFLLHSTRMIAPSNYPSFLPGARLQALSFTAQSLHMITSESVHLITYLLCGSPSTVLEIVALWMQWNSIYCIAACQTPISRRHYMTMAEMFRLLYATSSISANLRTSPTPFLRSNHLLPLPRQS